MPTYSYQAGYYDARPYFVDVERPGSGAAYTFSVTLFYRDGTTLTERRVARIHDTPGTPVFEKRYERSQPTVTVSMDVWDACRTIDANWLKYARQYERNHRP